MEDHQRTAEGTTDTGGGNKETSKPTGTETTEHNCVGAERDIEGNKTDSL